MPKLNIKKVKENNDIIDYDYINSSNPVEIEPAYAS